MKKAIEVQELLAADKTDLGILITKPAGRRHTSGTAEKSEVKMIMKNPEGQRSAGKDRNGTADDHRWQTLSVRERALSTTKKHKEVGIIAFIIQAYATCEELYIYIHTSSLYHHHHLLTNHHYRIYCNLNRLHIITRNPKRSYACTIILAYICAGESGG